MEIENKMKRPFKDKMVLFLGRITSQKGPSYFVEAANQVLKKKKMQKWVVTKWKE